MLSDDPTGDELQRLLRRYQVPLHSFFANRGFSREDCQDLTQETFLQAFKSLPAFRGDSGFSAWLFSIAKNIWKNALRSRKRLKRTGKEVPLVAPPPEGADDASGDRELQLPAEEEHPLDGLIEEEQQRLLRHAIDELPEEMRSCVLLRFDQQLKYREIALVTQLSLDQVKSLLYQAREKLRKKLEDRFGTGGYSKKEGM